LQSLNSIYARDHVNGGILAYHDLIRAGESAVILEWFSEIDLNFLPMPVNHAIQQATAYHPIKSTHTLLSLYTQKTEAFENVAVTRVPKGLSSIRNYHLVNKHKEAVIWAPKCLQILVIQKKRPTE